MAILSCSVIESPILPIYNPGLTGGQPRLNNFRTQAQHLHDATRIPSCYRGKCQAVAQGHSVTAYLANDPNEVVADLNDV
ncbi:unnamed protein product [Rhizoctonia solani]|uniref:Uncharacterized protein n=1 Tax=Rhizoctonia solani TaxID=456999 RepID=A0A8H2WEV2_9AGAM|nr:unnamed protein product [Rhizoctonia solani]